MLNLTLVTETAQNTSKVLVYTHPEEITYYC